MSIEFIHPNAAQFDRLLTAAERQNLLLTQLITSNPDATPVATLREIHEIVRAGEAEHAFAIGDQLMLNYNDGSQNYVLPWDIVAFEEVELEDGETVPGMIIESHYAMQGVQFDGNEAFCLGPLAAGTYHFAMGNSWESNVVAGKVYQFTLAQAVPEGGLLVLGTASSTTSGLPDTAPENWRVRTYANGSTMETIEVVSLSEGSGGTDLGTLSSSTKYGTSGLNNMQRSAYGYNRWGQSGMRQWLNSAAAAGAWWSSQNPYDRAPDQLPSIAGFMAGFDEAFLNIIKPVKVRTALNTVSDDQIGTYEDTYDTFFLPSLEQEYIVPQASGIEGAYWPYWKQRMGLSAPQIQGGDGANANHIRYAYNAKTSPQNCRLRSASRGYAYLAWIVYTTGAAVSTTATYAYRGCPACVIC